MKCLLRMAFALVICAAVLNSDGYVASDELAQHDYLQGCLRRWLGGLITGSEARLR